MILHVLLYIGLCASPALILLPVRWLDREPDNAITHESGGHAARQDQEGDLPDLAPRDDEPDGMLAAA